MCGIVGAIAERDTVEIMLEGLRRLEYRGYDSAGIATVVDKRIARVRVQGKIAMLQEEIAKQQISGTVGVGHTRWATHGAPSERNAHPHVSGDRIVLVHNGIIENHETLRETLSEQGFVFSSQTDTEVIAHQIEHYSRLGESVFSAVQKAVRHMKGAYGLGVVSADEPERLIAARMGSPLVIGIGIGEHFIASDVSALLPVTRQFIFLEDGDIANITRTTLEIYDGDGNLVERPVHESSLSADSLEKGEYRHFMEKEIFEQPKAISETLEGRISQNSVLDGIFGSKAAEIFPKIERVQIIACGTSYHAGMVAKYWFEDILSMPCNVDIASEYRYRNTVVENNTLFVSISQSGETADTIAAIKKIKHSNPTLTICNVAESSLTRESDIEFLTHAGPEIGVASTKAFTTQLVSLLLMIVAIGKAQARLPVEVEDEIVQELRELPNRMNRALALNGEIEALSAMFADKQHALFLGRGIMYPIAMEGSLKLKEVSYIHAESYPAGELKHGPLALIDDKMPVIAVAPDDRLLDKLLSNLEEVRSRSGELFVFSDHQTVYHKNEQVQSILISEKSRFTAPIIFILPFQLLAYHVALVKGTDVDQPRNLAKSVTVE
jgi:glutamine---fructose-6-phosphate transaminase (isomerizing)